MGYLMPKVGGGRVGWLASHVYGRPAGFGELLSQINGGTHSLHL
jgi:hypothetical protein